MGTVANRSPVPGVLLLLLGMNLKIGEEMSRRRAPLEQGRDGEVQGHDSFHFNAVGARRAKRTTERD